MKIPVLVGCSNFLVAMCNFSIMYFLPMWFVTVAGTSASIAGACWMLVVSLDVKDADTGNSRPPPYAQQPLDVCWVSLRGLDDAPHRSLQAPQRYAGDFAFHRRDGNV